MDKKPADAHAEIQDLRRKIDALDDQLIALFKERIGIVSRVGEIKRRENPGRCPIRAGREAEMVRRVMGEFEGSDFPPAAAAALWRTLIGASTAREGALILSVFAPDTQPDLYWLGREYFGPFIPSIRQPQIKRVIGDILDGKASVGLVPYPHSSDTSYWWTNLIDQGNDMPRIFARVPFVQTGAANAPTPSGLAIARIEPEESGDDVSLVVLDVDHNVSQSRLQAALLTARLEAAWINIATLKPTSRHHLVEIRGFHSPDSPAMGQFLQAMGGAVFSVSYLGAYAAPVQVADTSRRAAGNHVHAKNAAK